MNDKKLDIKNELIHLQGLVRQVEFSSQKLTEQLVRLIGIQDKTIMVNVLPGGCHISYLNENDPPYLELNVSFVSKRYEINPISAGHDVVFKLKKVLDDFLGLNEEPSIIV